MARRPPSKPVEAPAEPKPKRDWFFPARVAIWFARPFVKFLLIILLISTVFVSIFKWVNPPLTYLMFSEFNRLGTIHKDWRDLEDMSIYVPLAVVAAEDANFCAHNGFDFDAIEVALEEGAGRGASTISQQVAKNVFLWPGRSWLRKGLETGITVLIESLWSKRRIIEVYLNVAEFDEGVFGVDTAIAVHFGYSPENLRLADASRLAVVLPNPKQRAAGNLPWALRRQASRVAIGAATLRDEGRADCFLP
ncbi:monofunctional biosynthetic peptidoglycan transglycosylase [Rhodobacterales bacterium 52_120_T64]|nr:monofunctional biosynthetic peptidoglycan transglycosylase [Rhodobacterales bacterium 52_120_T64]